jgi:hypothetical protein
VSCISSSLTSATSNRRREPNLLSFLFYVTVLVVGLTISNITAKLIDYALYRYLRFKYTQAARKELLEVQAQLLANADPGKPVLSTDAYGPGLN